MATRLIYRTRSNPGPEQSATEIKLRNLLQTRFQMVYARPDQYERIDAEIAKLRAKMDAPRRATSPAKPRSEPSEAEILKAIMQLLHKHPKVAKVWRQNSGTFVKQYGDRTHYIRANTAKGMSDIMGILKDGRTLAIEVKSRTGIVAAHQHEFLNSISAAGGVAFVARSVDDVLERLNRFRA